MNIGVLGAGRVGTTLGAALVRAGHTVTYGTRDTLGQVATAAEGVVLATPYDALDAVVRAVGSALDGKVVIDASNPLRSGAGLEVGHTESGAEVLQRRVPTARVVKCFNTVGTEVMANPQVAGRAATMFLCGDDAGARGTAAALARAIGFQPLDVGALTNARLLEPAAALWVHLAMVERLGRRIALRLESEGARAAPRVTSSPARSIAIIGAGHIGAGLCRAWLAAGHRVTLGVRSPEKVQGLPAAEVADAVAQSDVVALALPAQAVDGLAATAGFAGKVVIDCTNRLAPGFKLEFGHTTSWAEQVAKVLPGAKVFKSFNAQGAENLVAPVYASGRAANFFCGDDAAGREVVSQLVVDVGFEPVFAGPLKNARLLEPLMLLWVAASRALGRRSAGFQLLRE
ncbi:MAG: NAD(P)-binding domain-containing protein [Myxococcaceae bacterium]|nr:NAD(P)-binding domain-containing protein [Myxococcaceae bacterium]